MDSTPDQSKVDQMALVIRYCTSSSVHERLVQLSPIKSHTGESIFVLLEEFLEKAELNIVNCRGQSYDNASNMSGKYKGLQAHVKNKCDLAVYIPCTAHSLNLVGVHSVDCCIEAVSFFGFLQCIFNIFSGSTHRWDILTNTLDKNVKGRLLVLKSLSQTRWSCHSDSCQALTHNYIKIIKALKCISENNSENGDSKRDAKMLLKQIKKKETAYLSFLWNDILNRSNKTSIHLQDSSCDPLKALNLLKSLKNYILKLLNSSVVYESKVIELGPEINSLYHDERRRTSKKNVSGSNNTVLQGGVKFRIETHNIIIDKFCSELDRRIEAYKFVSDNFLFVTMLCVPIVDKLMKTIILNKVLKTLY
ncbi:zinc finger MYM-type protein 1-like [Acyrthosiphon pisum]|uniref:Zinc finger MYM-type protein 1-like n=1 Tax=Acyrthosiphon pisum TaxID=7029 RepID=A0A8R2B255_ACYPI|nr:zinc finger MYM-type protein 1-like [Acyrthosiphon pisum]|eukprot:XP_008178736.1 PREDICTED: zinc finger MYM-type protein 1-like [Acyrthosiphon pisum]